MGSRGVILVQVIVLSALLGAIATYLLSWAWGRYQLVSRQQAFTQASGQVEGCLQHFQSTYVGALSAGTALPAVYTCPDGAGSIQVTPLPAPGVYRLRMTRAVTNY